MKAWKKGAVWGGVWGFISWFGLDVVMSNSYISLNFNRPGRVLETLFSAMVKTTLFLPAKVVVILLKVTSENDPVSGAFQNIALFPAVFLVGIILGSIILVSIEKYRTWRHAE